MATAEKTWLPPGSPPCPPPDGESNVAEIIETQARTISYLLSNYDKLLRKVEHEHEHESQIVVWSIGAQSTFQPGATVPAGWWLPLNSAQMNFDDCSGGGTFFNKTVDPQEPFFSTGLTQTIEALTAAKIMGQVEWVEAQPIG